jgi:hypothetical protein
VRLAPLLVLTILAAGCAGGGGSDTIAKKELSKLVVAKGDVPKGFEQFYAGRQVGLDNQGTVRADPNRYGREGGWITRYHRGGSPTTRGPLVIESRADLFKDAGGAKKDLAAYRVQFEHAPGASSVAVPKLGDESIAMTIRQPGSLVRTYAIAWRSRNATGSVTVNGFAGLRLDDALALARKQERRVAAE